MSESFTGACGSGGGEGPPASPRLFGITEGLDELLRPMLSRAGVASHVVIANNWDDAAEFADEFWREAPRDELEVLWTRSECLCRDRIRTLAKEGQPKPPVPETIHGASKTGVNMALTAKRPPSHRLRLKFIPAPTPQQMCQ